MARPDPQLTAPLADVWFDALLQRAAAIPAASDLVLEPDDAGGLVVRVRSEGVYHRFAVCPREQAAAAFGRLKALARLPAYITEEPQDGRLDGRPFGFAGDLRVAFLPTMRGQRAALRLSALGALPAPEALGLGPAALDRLAEAVNRADGLVLVTGPTGSGKTTTIHSLLQSMARTRPDRQIVAIEDPVERRLEGLAQVEVKPHLGFGFPEALRATLRQDVDVIVVGEIRDSETAQATVRAALTGHLVIATCHTGRAHEAVPRLCELGADPRLLVSALTLVATQRLVRLRHADCQGAGCGGCLGGFRGRRAVCDLMAVDHAARLVLLADGRPPLASDLTTQAGALVAEGLTTADEVARVLSSERKGFP